MDQELLEAVKKHDLDAVENALLEGADINLEDEDDMPLISTAIQIALERHDLKIVEILLSWPNLNINAQSCIGWTALHIAAAAISEEADDIYIRYYPELIELLLKNGADPKIKTTDLCQTPLLKAIAIAECRPESNHTDRATEENNFFRTIKLLANHETVNISDIDMINIGGEDYTWHSPLMSAIRYIPSIHNKNLILEIVKYFVNELNAPISIKNNYDESAFDFIKNNDMVKEFLEKKLKERIKTVQHKIKQEILDSTPIPDVLAALTSEYLESETTQTL